MDTDVLLPYQKAWLADASQVKVWEKSRRIGASYVEALASVLAAMAAKEAGGQNTYYLSYNKEMTQQFVKDCAFWAKTMNAACSEVEEVAVKNEDQDITVYRIRFASGFDVWGLPSESRSLRSKQGRVVIDEAAFVEDLGELLKAAMALLMWGGQVRILSTHNGDDNPFNELVKEVREGKKPYGLHKTTIDDALRGGLYQRICLVGKRSWSEPAQAAWRAELFDFYGDAADEELLCIPLRSGTRYFSTGLLDSCAGPTPVIRLVCEDAFTFESEGRREKRIDHWFKNQLRDLLRTCDDPVFLGQDFARSGDLTVIWLDRAKGGRKTETLAVVELRNVPFAQQWQTLRLIMETLKQFQGGALDARGNGQMIAELAAQEWPGYVSQVMLTAKWYAENFPVLKSRMEDLDRTIPDDPFLKDDFRAVGLVQGVPRVLERTGSGRERRHGDGAIAACLAEFAASVDQDQTYQPYAYEAVAATNRYLERGDEWDYWTT